MRKVVLYGSGSESIPFIYLNEKGSKFTRSHPFEGILHNFERRYRKLTPARCAKNWSNTKTASPAPVAAARACAARRAMCGWAAKPCTPSTNGRSSKPPGFSLQPGVQRAKAGSGRKIVKEISDRVQFLVNVGLDYLSLDRSADTLSGGEAQRIRLASQIGSGLTGVMYVLDEPSIGLHQRDNDRLLATLMRLRDLGNSVIVVEHDEDAIRAADYVVDMGPGAGGARRRGAGGRHADRSGRAWGFGHRGVFVWPPANRRAGPARAPDPARWLTLSARAATT